MALLHTNKDGETLYAVAAEGFDPKLRAWVTIPITHIHAPEPHIARFRFLQSVKNAKRVRIIALAPAIGWHGNEHGDKAVA